MGLDPRIGAQFLNAGVGWGGSCFPKDVRALEFMAEVGELPPAAAARGAGDQPRRGGLVDQLTGRRAGCAWRATVAVLGLAFKPNTDDLRDAPALDIVRRLLEVGGARVRAYDPAAMPQARALLPGAASARDAYDGGGGADAVAW